MCIYETNEMPTSCYNETQFSRHLVNPGRLCWVCLHNMSMIKFKKTLRQILRNGSRRWVDIENKLWSNRVIFILACPSIS